VHYVVEADREFFAVGRSRYNSAIGLGRRLLGMVPVALLILYAVLLIAASAGWLDWTGYAPPRGFAGLLIGVSLVPGLMLLYSRTRKGYGQLTVTPGSTGLDVRTGNVQALVGWQNFLRAVRFPDGVLLLQEKGLYRWLPDTALQESTSVEVVELLRRKIPVEMHA